MLWNTMVLERAMYLYITNKVFTNMGFHSKIYYNICKRQIAIFVKHDYEGSRKESKIMPKEKKPDFPTLLKEHAILQGMVVYSEKKKDSTDDDSEFLCVDYKGTSVFILKKDAILYPYSPSLIRLVGDKIKFCVTELVEYGTPNEKIYGSMKAAKEVLVAPVMERLKNGEVLTGIVLNAVQSGAYIAVGDVQGLMKNDDFSDDGSEIRDHYQRGSKIRVKFKRISKGGCIYFLPEEKKKGTSNIKIKDLSVGRVVAGKITHSFPDRVYVTVLPGVEVLCFCPTNLGLLRDNDMVSVKIKRIYESNGEIRVKGKILGKKENPIEII